MEKQKQIVPQDIQDEANKLYPIEFVMQMFADSIDVNKHDRNIWIAGAMNERSKVERLEKIVKTLNMRLTGKFEIPKSDK